MPVILKTAKSNNLILGCFEGDDRELTKTDIQKLTGLSYRTVFSKRVPDLIRQGKLKVVGKEGASIKLKLGVVV